MIRSEKYEQMLAQPSRPLLAGMSWGHGGNNLNTASCQIDIRKDYQQKAPDELGGCMMVFFGSPKQFLSTCQTNMKVYGAKSEPEAGACRMRFDNFRRPKKTEKTKAHTHTQLL